MRLKKLNNVNIEITDELKEKLRRALITYGGYNLLYSELESFGDYCIENNMLGNIFTREYKQHFKDYLLIESIHIGTRFKAANEFPKCIHYDGIHYDEHFMVYRSFINRNPREYILTFKKPYLSGDTYNATYKELFDFYSFIKHASHVYLDEQGAAKYDNILNLLGDEDDEKIL